MKKKFFIFLMSLLMIFSLTGCTTLKNQVAYTVYPIGYLIDRISQNTVVSKQIGSNTIVQRSQIVEGYEEILENSDALFYVGRIEPYLTIYRKNIVDLVPETIDLSSVNAVYKFERYTQIITEGKVSYVETPYYIDPSFDAVDVTEKDLNLWLDPISMLSMAKDITDWLCEKYPDNEQLYRDNCKALETDLIRIDASYQALATKNQNEGKSIKFVSMTASFGNWQKTYNIQVYPVILSKYGSLPTEEQLNAIKQRITNDNVKYIAYEPNMTDDMKALYDELKEEMGLEEVVINNLSSLTNEQIETSKDYISIMYENLNVLSEMALSNVSEEMHDILES